VNVPKRYYNRIISILATAPLPVILGDSAPQISLDTI